MKRLILLVSLVAILFSYPVNALASNIVNAIYRGTIVVTNNGTSAASSVSANMTLSSADLISQGYVTSNFSNAAIRNNAGADVPFMPSYGSNPWLFWVPSIGANSQLNYIFYAGGPDMTSTKYYFPDTAGATVNASNSLHFGSNFTIKHKGYVDVTIPGIIASQDPVFDISIPVSGNITGTVRTPTSPTSTVASIGWVNPNNSWDGDTTTAATTTFGGIGASSVLEVTRAAFTTDKIIFFTDRQDSAIDSVTVQAFYGGAWNVIFAAAANWGGWTSANLSPAQSVTGIRIQANNSGVPAKTFSVYELAYTTASTVMVGGLNSGETTVTLKENSVNLWLTAGGLSSANISAVTAINGTSTIQFGSNSTPYIEYNEIDASGAQKGYWQWQYGATFSDLTGNGNTMYPSFKTVGSNPNVWGTLTTFGLIHQANAPPYTVTNPQAFYSTNVTMTGNFSSGNVTGSGLPGSTLVDDAAQAAHVPNVFLWGLFGGLFLVAGGFLISAISRFWGAGNGELIARIIWGIFVIGVLIALGKFDMWMLWFYLILTIAMALASRHNEVGAYFSELNFIGFLSMAEVGMITINRILEGSFINSADASQFNNLMFTQQFTILNVFTLPIVNFDFFTKGLPNLLKWNYVMFGGNAQMIQYLLYALTAIMGFIIFGLVIGTLSHYFTK